MKRLFIKLLFLMGITSLSAGNFPISLPPRKVHVGYAADQNAKHRSMMQDVMLCSFPFYGVFDGHGKYGYLYADSAKKQIHNLLSKKTQNLSIEDIFFKTDDSLFSYAEQLGRGGTTATIAWFNEKCTQLTYAYTGDSRMMIFRNNFTYFETEDHKPTWGQEKARIENALGRVSKGGYIYAYGGRHGVNMTRCLGDFDLKCFNDSSSTITLSSCNKDDYKTKFVAIAQPSYGSINIKRKDVVVIASDGLWDAMSASQVSLFLQRQFLVRSDYPVDSAMLQNIAYFLVQKAIRDGSKDNVSVMILYIE